MDSLLQEDGTSKILQELGPGSNILLEQQAASTNIKSVSGVAYASIKSVSGVAIASVGKVAGLASILFWELYYRFRARKIMLKYWHASEAHPLRQV